MKHILMAVSGPAGVGKGTIVKTIIDRREDIVESVSCTTRTPRKGEVDGKHYFFLSKEEFERRIAEDDFLEYNQHFGNYYGTPKSFVKEALKEKSVIMEIEVVGALNAKKAFPECILVMVVPPSVDVLRKRLQGRGSETEAQIEDRLSRMNYELAHQSQYDYIIVNDDLEQAIADLCKIIDGE